MKAKSEDYAENKSFEFNVLNILVVFVGMIFFILINDLLWYEVDYYYPEWGYKAFMYPWFVFTILSLGAMANTGDVSAFLAKTLWPYLVIMIPFFTGLVSGSAKVLSLHTGPGVLVALPPDSIYGFEEHCLYAGLVSLIAVRFIPYRNRF